MTHRTLIILILIQVLTLPLHSAPTVESELRDTAIEIGKQTELRIKISGSARTSIEFPSYDSLQSLSPGIEVLSQRDTTSGDYQIRAYTITSFDTSVVKIVPLQVKIEGKTYQTKELPLKILSMPIDTANVDQIKSLKGSMEPPFRLSEWVVPFLLSVITLLVSLVITYIIIRIKDNKPIIRRVRLTPYIPPHKAALTEISKIKSEALVESDDSKAYYTRLTDALRRYMQGRYGFNAMEMTTDEIISSIENINDPEAIHELNELFTTADLVKFAKARPDISANDRNLLNAINYIQNTKKEEVVETSPEEVVIVDIRSKRSKRILYGCILIALIAITITTTYLIRQIYILNY